MSVKLFISYASEDIEKADLIYSELKEMPEVEPWLDKYNLLPGMDWEFEIMNVLDECRFVIILFSNNSVSKTGFIQKEIKEVLSNLDNYPVGKIYIIPVKIDECEIRDRKIKKIQWVNLYDDWSGGIEKIKLTIQRELFLEMGNAYEYSIYKDSILNFKKNKLEELVDKLSLSELDRYTPYESNSKYFVDLRSINHKESMDYLRNINLLPVLFDDFVGANFINLNLEKVNFENKNLSGANFVHCNLQKANFSNTVLKGANFERANLDSANFDNSEIWGVNFWGANLENVKGLGTVINSKHINLYKAKNIPEILLSKTFSGKTIDLPDYNGIFNYFCTHLKMSLEDFKKVFKWCSHEYFNTMLSDLVSKK